MQRVRIMMADSPETLRESERRDRAMLRRGTRRGIYFSIGIAIALVTSLVTSWGVQDAIEEGWSRALEAGSAARYALVDGLFGGFLAFAFLYSAWRLGRRLPPRGKEDDEP